MQLDDLIDQIDQIKDISQHTILRYKQIVRKLHNAGLQFTKKDNTYTLNFTPRQIQKTIENLKTPQKQPLALSYKRDMFSTLKGLHKRNLITLTDTQLVSIQKQTEILATRYQFSKGKNEQKQSNLTLEQIQKLVRNATLSPQKLILALLTFAPTRRLEYRNLNITHRKPPKNDLNYLAVYKNKLVFYLRDYKGSQSKGEWTYTLPPTKSDLIPPQLYDTMTELYDIISDYLTQNKDNKFLFENSMNQPYEQAQFSQFIINSSKQILGQELSLNYFRHLFTSTYQSYDNVEDSQLEFIADYMGHSRDMQQEYFYLDLAKKSLLQINDQFEFNHDNHQNLGVFYLFKDTQTGTFYAVPYKLQD